MVINSKSNGPAILFSIDSHVGPRLKEDLRPYCPKRLLAQFDEAVGQQAAMAKMTVGNSVFGAGGDPEAKAEGERLAARLERNSGPGHYDMDVRVGHMDRDGVSAEVIFHGSQNFQPMPFMGGAGARFSGGFAPEGQDLELVAAGQHIYNQWLADAVSKAPDRLIGLASLPLWDIPAALDELRWARDAGLRGVNFPAPRMGLVEFDDLAYEEFWAACESLDVKLCTHSGVAFFSMPTGPHFPSILELEGGGWPSRRGLARMIFGGVFARHPSLTLVMVEQPGEWWNFAIREMDSSYKSHYSQLRRQVPVAPSEYMKTNVYLGASFTAPFEARGAVEGGNAANLLWGRDYPHIEGTFQNTGDEGPNMTQLSLRHAFAGLPHDQVRLMVGENAVRVFGLDSAKLSAIAAQIGASSIDDITTPIDDIPQDGGSLSFRTVGAWG